MGYHSSPYPYEGRQLTTFGSIVYLKKVVVWCVAVENPNRWGATVNLFCFIQNALPDTTPKGFVSLLRTEQGIFCLLGEDVNHYTMEHFSTLVIFSPLLHSFFLVFLKQQAVWGVSRKLCVNNCTTFCWKPVIRWNGIHPTFDGHALISRNLLTHTPLCPPKKYDCTALGQGSQTAVLYVSLKLTTALFKYWPKHSYIWCF